MKKTNVLPATVALATVLSIFAIVEWKSGPVGTPPDEPYSHSAVPSARTEMRTETAEVVEPPPAHEPATIRFEAAYGLASAESFQSRIEAANGLQIPALLAEMERMPASPLKDEMMRSALKKWAAIDGTAAANWARLRAQSRPFVPEILQSWADAGTDAAASAWRFAKSAFSTDQD